MGYLHRLNQLFCSVLFLDLFIHHFFYTFVLVCAIIIIIIIIIILVQRKSGMRRGFCTLVLFIGKSGTVKPLYNGHIGPCKTGP